MTDEHDKEVDISELDPVVVDGEIVGYSTKAKMHIDPDYEARKQSMIESANEKALARLEEIDRWISERAETYPYQMPAVQYVMFMSTVTQDEIDAYIAWCDTKLQMLVDKAGQGRGDGTQH